MLYTTLLMTLGCNPTTIETDDTGNPGTGDDTGDTDTDTDTDDTNDTNEPVDGFGNLSAEIHDDHGSLVMAGWGQDEAGTVHIEYTFENGDWLSSPSYATAAGEHQIPLVGIPYDMDVEWRLVVEEAETFTPQTLDGDSITTDDYPSRLPQPVLLESDESQWLTGANYILTSINEDDGGWTQGTYWTVI
ncbi:MAG: hypothetical protein ACI8RZ_006545, partial [Myxococcota bacterium]